MKKLAFFLFSIVLLSSCSKDEKDPYEFDNTTIDVDLYEKSGSSRQRLQGKIDIYIYDTENKQVNLHQDPQAFIDGYALDASGNKLKETNRFKNVAYGCGFNVRNYNRYLVMVYSYRHKSYTSFLTQPIKYSRVYYTRTFTKEPGYEESNDSNLKMEIKRN